MSEQQKEPGFTCEAPYISEARKKAKEYLGSKWLLHPDNAAKKK